MALAVFDPLLCDFDGIIVMRREAIPQADSALRHPQSAGGKTLRYLAKLLAPAGFAGSEDDLVVPPKSARALLRNVPKRKPLHSSSSKRISHGVNSSSPKRLI